MSKPEISMQELEQLAARMAAAIPDLDCPECCECTWKYHYIEGSAQMYQEEWEWAILVGTIHHYHRKKKSGPAEQGGNG
jgi:hypothetical protein